ncbi:DNA-methyltransferase [Vallitalea guaymasensis]|uniref:DNA-methyltransferase n=1 Tax=Vallitalea guaymasensis TaxID=1185412 RepID=UPI002355866B|nr:site-specific DNA-methyltransferase [Vallitalea guaymasensis]
MNKIKLYNDDCINSMQQIDGNTVDLIITDPPYNLGLFMQNRQTNLKKMRNNFFGAAGWDDLEYDEWLLHMDDFLRESSRVLRKKGTLIVFMSLIKVESLIRIAEKNNFYYKTTGIWHKLNPMPRNMNLHFVNSTEGWVYFINKAKTGTFNNDGKVLHDFFESSLTPVNEKRFGKHPTQKPEKLMEYFIKTLSKKNDVILDPFMGSGTTGVVSKRLSRNYIGIEINQEYFSSAKKRIDNVEVQDVRYECG